MTEIETEFVSDWLVIRFTSPSLIEPMILDRLSTELQSHLAPLPPKCKVLMSFKGVQFVSSQIIGIMLGSKDTVKKKGGQFVLARLGTNIMEVLKLTRLDSQFTIVETESEIIGRRRTRKSQAPELPDRPAEPGDLDWQD